LERREATSEFLVCVIRSLIHVFIQEHIVDDDPSFFPVIVVVNTAAVANPATVALG
jgi:hypothetical protein